MPLTGIRGSEQRISGCGTPNRSPHTDSHAIRQAFVLPSHGATRGALIAAHSAHRPFFLFAPIFFLCAYRQLSTEISRPDRLEVTVLCVRAGKHGTGRA